MINGEAVNPTNLIFNLLLHHFSLEMNRNQFGYIVYVSIRSDQSLATKIQCAIVVRVSALV